MTREEFIEESNKNLRENGCVGSNTYLLTPTQKKISHNGTTYIVPIGYDVNKLYER